MAAEKGVFDADGSELFGDWCPTHPRAAWLLYSMTDALDMKHLPGAGGLLEQDELVMEDVALLRRMGAFVRAQLEADEADP